MIPISEIKAAGYNIAVSTSMMKKIREWGEMYENNAPWLLSDYEKSVTSLELPSGISSELARLILHKGKSWVCGKGGQKNTPRSEWIQQQYSHFMKGIRQKLELACAVGGMVFKPYISGNKLYIDTIANDRFIPCAFDLEGNIIEAVFVSGAVIGNSYYTRLEHHKWQPDQSYIISNRCFCSSIANSLGNEINLESVPQWRNIKPKEILRNIKQPLFSYFRFPMANNIDRSSAMGVSCFSRAINQIRQADEQWERIMWEFQGSELAIMAESGMFKIINGKSELPTGKERLYRIVQEISDKESMHEFAPNIRDTPLFHGLNRIFQRIEFNCGLAYGTISDPQTVEKTAEEVRGSKQRSLTHIQNIQSALEDALQELIHILDIYADLYELAPSGEYETVFEWGDGVTEDRDKEFARRMQLASAGKYKWESFLAWYFGCSEEKAAEMIPQELPLFGGDA